MKTFETEKHNIPEGATHYSNENDESYFLWLHQDSGGNLWALIEGERVITTAEPIPQQEAKMNIDKLATQVEEVEWVSGDACVFDNRAGVFVGLSKNPRLAVVEIDNDLMPHDIDLVKVCDLSKPETKQQREEREELEAAYDLYRDYCDGTNFKGVDFDLFKDPTDNREIWLGIVRKTGYRKEG